MTTQLPTGQRERDDFPRFGLTPFARRFPAQTHRIAIAVSGLISPDAEIDEQALATLARHQRISVFYCVTTWSHRG